MLNLDTCTFYHRHRNIMKLFLFTEPAVFAVEKQLGDTPAKKHFIINREAHMVLATVRSRDQAVKDRLFNKFDMKSNHPCYKS